MEGLSEESSGFTRRTGAYDCDCESPNPTVADIVGGAWEWLDGFKGWCAGDEGSFSENWWFIYGDELCEINQSFRGNDAAVLAPSRGEKPASPRHRAEGAVKH